MTKLLVVGNCQARPIGAILERSGLFELLPPITLHLATAEDAETDQAKIKEADVVLAQKTANDFHRVDLRSSVLREKHNKALVWPNVFYSGQQPYIRYFTHASEGRLLGPLEAMHDLRIFSRWLVSRGVVDEAILDESFANRVAESSLAQLKNREAGCDVTISEYLEREAKCSSLLFFTFNHPNNAVLWHLALKILDALGHRVDIPYDTSAPQALGRFVVPSTWSTEETIFQGDDIELDEETGKVTRLPGPPKKYTAEELETRFFDVYDKNTVYRDLAHIRLTPKLPEDQSLFEKTVR